MLGELRRRFGLAFPRVTTYRHNGVDAVFAGVNPRALGFARSLLGGDPGTTIASRQWHKGIEPSLLTSAAEGNFAVTRDLDRSLSPSAMACAIEVPAVINQEVPTADAIAEIEKSHKKSTIGDDLRRVTKIPFDVRIETDPAIVREFYERFYLPLIKDRFEGDEITSSCDELIDWIGKGGELLCIDYKGTWIGGDFNVQRDGLYAMSWLGVRDSDPQWYDVRIIPALYIHSIKRAHELGIETIGFGKALPLLGPGVPRFKSKYQAIIKRDKFIRATVRMWMDLRHANVRTFLARDPVVICHRDELGAVQWLEPDDGAIKLLKRDIKRFRGLSRWCVLAAESTHEKAQLQGTDDVEVIPIGVPETSAEPLWVGSLTNA